MEAATAFQIACGVVQLIDFSFEALKTYRQISGSASSLSTDNEQIDERTRLISNVASTVKTHLHQLDSSGLSLTDEQQHLRNVAERCTALAMELQNMLDQLKSAPHPSRKKRLLQTWKTFRIRNQIDDLHQRLRSYQQQLDSANLANLCHGMDLSSSQNRQMLEQLNLHQVESLQTLQDMNPQLQSFVKELQHSFQSEIRQSTQVLQNIHSTTLVSQQQRNLLNSLNYPTINSRRNDIRSKHKNTYEWIFDPLPKPWPSFVEWLETGSGIYWINGKLGSGKSTLMKFLIGASRLRDSLQKWKGDWFLSTPHFFFWRPGAVEQRSMHGFYCSILHQIYTGYSELMGKTLPLQSYYPHWTTAELSETLRVLLQEHSHESRLKLCFFIDGLDEIGDKVNQQEELFHFIEEIAKLSHVKICISSRPEQNITDIFAKYSFLRLQDLTEADIDSYVNDKLNARFQGKQITENQLSIIIGDIKEKADGVFLWVCLVVQDLLRGLTARDTFEELQSRLRDTPADIESLFAMFMNKIDRVHRKTAARFLKCTSLVHGRPQFETSGNFWMKAFMPILIMAVLGQPEGNFSIGDFHLNRASEFNSSSWLVLLQAMSIRLREHTAGILEVSCQYPKGILRNTTCNFCSLSLDSESNLHASSIAVFDLGRFHHARFVHRCAFDFFQESPLARQFLQEDDMLDEDLIVKVTDAFVDIFEVLFQYRKLYEYVRRSQYERNKPLVYHHLDFSMTLGAIEKCLESCLSILSRSVLEDIASETLNTLLDYLDERISAALQDYIDSVPGDQPSPFDGSYVQGEQWDPGPSTNLFSIKLSNKAEYLFTNYALRFGFSPWLLQRLDKQDQDIFEVVYDSLVRDSLNWSNLYRYKCTLHLFSKLLNLGLPPNKNIEGMFHTPWKGFFEEFLPKSLQSSTKKPIGDIISTIKVFLKHGANVNETHVSHLCIGRAQTRHSFDLTTRRYSINRYFEIECTVLVVLDDLLGIYPAWPELRQQLVSRGAYEHVTMILIDDAVMPPLNVRFDGPEALRIFKKTIRANSSWNSRKGRAQQGHGGLWRTNHGVKAGEAPPKPLVRRRNSISEPLYWGRDRPAGWDHLKIPRQLVRLERERYLKRTGSRDQTQLVDSCLQMLPEERSRNLRRIASLRRMFDTKDDRPQVPSVTFCRPAIQPLGPKRDPISTPKGMVKVEENLGEAMDPKAIAGSTEPLQKYCLELGKLLDKAHEPTIEYNPNRYHTSMPSEDLEMFQDRRNSVGCMESENTQVSFKPYVERKSQSFAFTGSLENYTRTVYKGFDLN